MRTYTWDEYYEKFYDWAESTQIRNLSALTTLGPADEVAEIIIELQCNTAAANRLLKKALAAKLAFSGDALLEFLGINDQTLVEAAALNSAARLNENDLEELCGLIDDAVILQICSKCRLPLPEDLREEYDNAAPAPKVAKTGFFGKLFTAIGIFSDATHSAAKKHRGKCTGDCANCPPHYGYRYGRWYYGHNHTRGCEFGGNNGSGGAD